MNKALGWLLAAVLIPLQLYLMYQTTIAPRIARGDWHVPSQAELHVVRGALVKVGHGYVLNANDGGKYNLHCEPDPPLESSCLTPLLSELRQAREVEATIKDEPYERSTPGVLLIALQADGKPLITAEDTARRINQTYIECSRNGSCGRDYKRFGGSGDIWLVGFFAVILLLSVGAGLTFRFLQSHSRKAHKR
jgi:hypothetical protein